MICSLNNGIMATLGELGDVAVPYLNYAIILVPKKWWEIQIPLFLLRKLLSYLNILNNVPLRFYNSWHFVEKNKTQLGWSQTKAGGFSTSQYYRKCWIAEPQDEHENSCILENLGLGIGKKWRLIFVFFPFVLPECWLYCFLTADQQPQLRGSNSYVQLPRVTSPDSANKNSCFCSTFSSSLSKRILIESLAYALTNQTWSRRNGTVWIWGYCKS